MKHLGQSEWGRCRVQRHHVTPPSHLVERESWNCPLAPCQFRNSTLFAVSNPQRASACSEESRLRRCRRHTINCSFTLSLLLIYAHFHLPHHHRHQFLPLRFALEHALGSTSQPDPLPPLHSSLHRGDERSNLLEIPNPYTAPTFLTHSFNHLWLSSACSFSDYITLPHRYPLASPSSPAEIRLLSNRNHVAKQSLPATSIEAIGSRSNLTSGKHGLSGTRQNATVATSLLGLVFYLFDLAPSEFCSSEDSVGVSRTATLLREIWSITVIRSVRPSTAGAAATRRESRRKGETPSTAVVDLLVRFDLLRPNLFLFQTAICYNGTVGFQLVVFLSFFTVPCTNRRSRYRP